MPWLTVWRGRCACAWERETAARRSRARIQHDPNGANAARFFFYPQPRPMGSFSLPTAKSNLLVFTHDPVRRGARDGGVTGLCSPIQAESPLPHKRARACTHTPSPPHTKCPPPPAPPLPLG